MDLYCKCGEPWEMDSLHDVCEDRIHAGDERNYEDIWREVKNDFRKHGCQIFGCNHSEVPERNKHSLQEALFEVMGDDIDGVASMMEDYGDLV